MSTMLEQRVNAALAAVPVSDDIESLAGVVPTLVTPAAAIVLACPETAAAAGALVTLAMAAFGDSELPQ